MRRSIGWSVGAVIVMVVSAGAQAPVPLPMAAPVQGTVADSPVEYSVVAKSAGVLSVAVKGQGDLSLQLVDEDGQVLPNGSADRDMNGDEGTELLSATISEPGTYRVRARRQGGDKSTFTIAGSFLGFSPFQRPGDHDRRPGSPSL